MVFKSQWNSILNLTWRWEQMRQIQNFINEYFEAAAFDFPPEFTVLVNKWILITTADFSWKKFELIVKDAWAVEIQNKNRPWPIIFFNAFVVCVCVYFLLLSFLRNVRLSVLLLSNVCCYYNFKWENVWSLGKVWPTILSVVFYTA